MIATKEWTINGYGSDKGIEFVERFSTREGIKKLFREVARDSGNSIYMPNVSERDVNVSLKQQPNPSYNTISPQKPGDNFPKQFTMVISQNITRSSYGLVPNLISYENPISDDDLMNQWNITDEEWNFID